MRKNFSLKKIATFMTGSRGRHGSIGILSFLLHKPLLRVPVGQV